MYVCLGISGWWESSLIDEVIHNRTVNLKGGVGHNIAMDRVCEFLNADFKGSLRMLYCSHSHLLSSL